MLTVVLFRAGPPSIRQGRKVGQLLRIPGVSGS